MYVCITYVCVYVCIYVYMHVFIFSMQKEMGNQKDQCARHVTCLEATERQDNYVTTTVRPSV